MALLARVEEALSLNRLFADAGLTLGRLADGVGCTPHQLSEVLNRYANISFHELLNRRRVADVKVQLLDPSADRYTIEGIGASAGFGSRSALYAAFRRLEGMTPAEFRAAKPAGMSRQSAINDPLQQRTDTVG
jgi:AraC-like DNA-binding protein